MLSLGVYIFRQLGEKWGSWNSKQALCVGVSIPSSTLTTTPNAHLLSLLIKMSIQFQLIVIDIIRFIADILMCLLVFSLSLFVS